MKYFNGVEVPAMFYNAVVDKCNEITHGIPSLTDGYIYNNIHEITRYLKGENDRHYEAHSEQKEHTVRMRDNHGNSIGFGVLDAQGRIFAIVMPRPSIICLSDDALVMAYIYYHGMRSTFRKHCDSFDSNYNLAACIEISTLKTYGEYDNGADGEGIWPAELRWEYVMRTGGALLHNEIVRILPKLVGRSSFGWGIFVPNVPRYPQAVVGGYHFRETQCPPYLCEDDFMIMQTFFNDITMMEDGDGRRNDVRVPKAMVYLAEASALDDKLHQVAFTF